MKIIVFCLGLMFGAIIRLPLMCQTLSKSSFILSGTIIFISYGVLGTFYHMKSLNLQLANEYAWLPMVCLLILPAYYSGGIAQNTRLYQHVLTSNRNRLAVKTITVTLRWLTIGVIGFKFNHAIWYIGIGWIYYNMALVSLFLMVFVILLLPGIVLHKPHGAQELTNSPSMESSDQSQRSSRSSSDATDTTIEVVVTN